jgi:hypothetical protein
LRKFEQLGIQATIEVQSAARKVAEENTLLRSLLRLHGVTDLEVETHLHRHNSGVVPSTLQAHGTSPIAATVPSEQTFPSYPIKSNPYSQPGLLHIEKPEEPYQEIGCGLMAPTRVGRPLDEVYSGTIRPGCRYPESHDVSQYMRQSACDPSASQTLPPCSHIDKDNTTSCERAAAIIANMRGNNDTEAARAELGCVSGTSCRVGNMSIFGALEG